MGGRWVRADLGVQSARANDLSYVPPGVVHNWSALQCSKQNTKQCGDDHAPVTRGRMQAQYPLPHGQVLMGSIDPPPPGSENPTCPVFFVYHMVELRAMCLVVRNFDEVGQFGIVLDGFNVYVRTFLIISRGVVIQVAPRCRKGLECHLQLGSGLCVVVERLPVPKFCRCDGLPLHISD